MLARHYQKKYSSCCSDVSCSLWVRITSAVGYSDCPLFPLPPYSTADCNQDGNDKNLHWRPAGQATTTQLFFHTEAEEDPCAIRRTVADPESPSMLLTGARPLNSALEIDLDFDRALRPPPPPTEEATATLEDMIKRRIAERRFDDPQRSAPPADDLQKELAELDDKRSSKVAFATTFLKRSAGLAGSRA